MAKGQQRSNREAKKPKKAKSPAPVPVSPGQRPTQNSRFVPGKPK